MDNEMQNLSLDDGSSPKNELKPELADSKAESGKEISHQTPNETEKQKKVMRRKSDLPQVSDNITKNQIDNLNM